MWQLISFIVEISQNIPSLPNVDILKVFGTIIFLIVCFFATQMYLKIFSQSPKTFFDGRKTKKKLDIIIPAVDLQLAIKNTKHLLKCENVKRIIIVNPEKEGASGKYLFVKDGKNGRAEAINMAIDRIESKHVLIIDEDHYVTEDSINKALRILDKYDIVKLTLLPNPDKMPKDLFRKTVMVERLFIEKDVIPKAVYPHYGGTGFFKTEVLKDLKFDNSFLTEDIDLTVRAYKKGYTIVSVPDVFAYEEYPSFKGWLVQRRRWAYGWFQVFRKHIKDLKHRKVRGILYSQLFTFIPLLIVPSLSFGNLLPPLVSAILSLYCIFPILLVGLKYGKHPIIALSFLVYYFVLMFYSSITSFVPLKKYVITPKGG